MHQSITQPDGRSAVGTRAAEGPIDQTNDQIPWIGFKVADFPYLAPRAAYLLDESEDTQGGEA
ncbi:MAG: hypothetical protein ABI574_04645 [Burkholderiales bacterium]